MSFPKRADVVVIGAGHNGLVAATLLARAGRDVVVLEAAAIVGGAARTEAPFPRMPGLRQSTGAYLLGLMPPELLAELGLELPLLRRDPHYFLPTTGSAHLIFGADREATRRQIVEFFSAADAAADAALAAELAALREDLAAAWLAEPVSLEETAHRYVRSTLQAAFIDACRGSVLDYLSRFGFRSDLLLAMYAVTDGLSGLAGGLDTPGSGHNFLVHNACRLPGADGTWMIVRGGMGTLTSKLAAAAQAAGARIETGVSVERILTSDGRVSGVAVPDATVAAPVVVVCSDPFRLRELLDPLPEPLAARLEALGRPGSTLKVNLALSGLPRFRCLGSDDPDPFGATIHLLPQERPLDAIRTMWADVVAGRLPEFPTIEWYVHTTIDPSLCDPGGHHSSALFVQSVPFQPEGSDWDRELDGYVGHLLEICDRFAPGTSDLVADVFALSPPGIERHFGITRGHIHHVDNAFAFDQRVPYRLGIDGLYAGGAGCHPAGSVIGLAGRGGARAVLADG